MAERRQEKACKDRETGLAGGRREEIRANEKVQKKKESSEGTKWKDGGSEQEEQTSPGRAQADDRHSTWAEITWVGRQRKQRGNTKCLVIVSTWLAVDGKIDVGQFDTPGGAVLLFIDFENL